MSKPKAEKSPPEVQTPKPAEKQVKAVAPEAALEALVQRVRALNEGIIAAGRDAGENTLLTYEKVLKAIAAVLESGPGASDIEWVANLAKGQAKFIRDITEQLTGTARDLLK